MKDKFSGVFSALVTPFDNGNVDYASLEKLVQFQIDEGVKGFVVNGTTAESPTLSTGEIKKIYSIVRALVGLNCPVILGTGSNSTAQTIENTKQAEELGADAALVVVPYYNKPPQRGLVEHFKAVSKATELPLIAYNVPGRTITAMSEETILSISEIKNVIGIKEASGDIIFDKQLKNKLRKDFVFLSGDDGTYIDFLNLGGHGIISVMSNLIPKETVNWTKSVLNGDLKQAQNDFKTYEELIKLMYIEANPIPIKWMLYKKGIIKSPEMRLPLVSLDEKYFSALENEMKVKQII